jgi:hypothetical protein
MDAELVKLIASLGAPGLLALALLYVVKVLMPKAIELHEKTLERIERQGQFFATEMEKARTAWRDELKSDRAELKTVIEKHTEVIDELKSAIHQRA